MALVAVVAGQRIITTDVNQIINMLNGVTGSGTAVTLIYNAASALTFQPSSDPAADTVAVAIKNNAGTQQSGLTYDGNAILKTYLSFSAAASKIRPGATSLSLRNNADSADNILVTDAGVVTVRSTLTVSGASVTIGTTPSTTGAIRIPYQGALSSRDSGNSADEILIRYNANVIELGAAGSSNVKTLGALVIGTRPAFVASDKYLVVDSSGNVHVSALGPAS